VRPEANYLCLRSLECGLGENITHVSKFMGNFVCRKGGGEVLIRDSSKPMILIPYMYDDHGIPHKKHILSRV
jgi:hypothetical protein